MTATTKLRNLITETRKLSEGTRKLQSQSQSQSQKSRKLQESGPGEMLQHNISKLEDAVQDLNSRLEKASDSLPAGIDLDDLIELIDEEDLEVDAEVGEAMTDAGETVETMVEQIGNVSDDLVEAVEAAVQAYNDASAPLKDIEVLEWLESVAFDASDYIDEYGDWKLGKNSVTNPKADRWTIAFSFENSKKQTKIVEVHLRVEDEGLYANFGVNALGASGKAITVKKQSIRDESGEEALGRLVYQAVDAEFAKQT